MELIDAEMLIGWIYDPVERRFGRAAAWFATMAAALLLVGILLGIILILVGNKH